MRTRGRRWGGLLLALIMLTTVSSPFVGSHPAADGNGDRGLASITEDHYWTDPLTDLSQVFVPGGGLVGVEVSGGAARLEAGATNGWFASEVIRCPPGYRYDLVYLEVDVPGGSTVEVSLLNATADATEVGFANEPMVGYKLRQETDLDLSDIDPGAYPEVRLQANLHASGLDRPRVLAWTLYFVGGDLWQDDFIGPGMMAEHRGLNFTDDGLEIDPLARRSSVLGRSGDPFPSVAIADPGAGAVHLFAPNEEGTSYKDFVSLTGYPTARGLTFEDMNGDGFLDMLVGATTLFIRWGDGDGNWPVTGQTALNITANYMATGDFNGDGEMDIGVSWGTLPGRIFLNQGNGTFNVDPDIFLTGYASWGCSSGDLDGDGYDDLVLGRYVFLGGPHGLGPTANITLGTTNDGFFSVVTDLDGDGHQDVLLANNQGGSAQIWLGGEDGPDVTADYALATTRTPYRVAVGDLNGDGYNEVVYAVQGTRIEFFEGTERGWHTSGRHRLTDTPNVNYGFNVHDVDKDGYSDVIVADDGTVDFYMGGTTWPTSPGITKVANTWCYNIAVAEKAGPPALVGMFTTRPIDLPPDRKWDVLNLEGDLPVNATMRLSVLDGSGGAIPGYEDVTEWNVDLSALDRVLYPTIQVKVTVTGQVGDPTPVLHRLAVQWLDLWTWRDQFYGEVRIDRLSGFDVVEGTLGPLVLSGPGPCLVFPSVLGDMGYTTTPMIFSDDGGLDYLAWGPVDLDTKGTSAVDVFDVNGDLYLDVAFAVHGTTANTFDGKSPIFLGGPLGINPTPFHIFDTTGASDVLIHDLNNDGYTDVVFAQMRKAPYDFDINSTLFWGSADGWTSTPSLEFTTRGASGVEAVDVNGDWRLDLVFSCYSLTSEDSMVFLQDENGYCSTEPSQTLATNGALAVASGDLDGDHRPDLVFANSYAGTSLETDSFIYWGTARGGFDEAPTKLPTIGASDVLVSDLDGNGNLDIVFANTIDDDGDREIDSYVYLNDGWGGFGPTPDARLPTVGASGVAVADLDGEGWIDLVFACQRNTTSYNVPSLVYLGGRSGWGSDPDISLPTEGASDVGIAQMLKRGSGGYMSVPITVEDARDTGTFHTFRYSSTLWPGQKGIIQMVDANTWEVLTETTMTAGSHEWDVSGEFSVRDHPSVRVVVVVDNLHRGGTFALDDLWLNWTRRVRAPPHISEVALSEPFVYRLGSVDILVNVTDDYDVPEHLVVLVQHRLNGTIEWKDDLTPTLRFDDTSGTWTTHISPRVDATVGRYDLRVSARDLDDQSTGWTEFPKALAIRNNLPTTPVVRWTHEKAATTTTLSVELVERSTDVESVMLTYIYRWFLDGEPYEHATSDTLPSYLTSKGENWTVEVTAYDGENESLPGILSVLIANAPPFLSTKLPDPEMEEDTIDDKWLNLTGAFDDADGDELVWSVSGTSDNLTITIDPATGIVTIEPAPNWHGDESVTFAASDGELTASQTVIVHVTSVNDIPTIETVDGEPVTADTIEYTIMQGETLVIRYTVADEDGDEVLATVTSLAVEHDQAARTITYTAPGDEVGTITFTLSISDVISVSDKVTIDFVINVENRNDPMGDPQITSPEPGATFKAKDSFMLASACDDPDVPLGQVLNFTWESDISGLLGFGPSLMVSIAEAGTHEITVTVRDPDFSASATITVVIEPRDDVTPPPPPDNGNDPVGSNWGLVAVIIAVLVIVGAVLGLLSGKRRTAPGDLVDASEERTAPQLTHDTIDGPADEWEADGEEWVETFEEM